MSEMGGSKDDLSEDDKKAEAFLKESDSVESYTVDDMLYLSKNQLSKGKNGQTTF